MTITLTHGDFSLSLTPIYIQSDILSSANTTLQVMVQRGGIAMAADMQVDIYDLAAFSAALIKMYSTLKGTAVINTPDSRKMHLTFTAQGGGRVQISGALTCDLGEEQPAFYSMEFTESIDQTSLGGFCRDLEQYIISLNL